MAGAGWRCGTKKIEKKTYQWQLVLEIFYWSFTAL
jgi:hypothetical protein